MRCVKSARVQNKRVLVRVDFNVPLKNGRVADDTRIRAALPTLKYLLSKHTGIIICSHLGRPKGKVVESLRLKPIAARLSGLLKKKVRYVKDFSADVKKGEVVMLENMRFHPGEESDSAQFAKQLASLGDVFVNDAFADCHRKHASVHAIMRYLPSYAGLLVEKEVKALSQLIKSPKKPVVAVIGGAKVGTKIGLLSTLTKKVDAILVGSAMAFTFYKALGWEVGRNKIEKDKLLFAKRLLKSKKIILPVDLISKKLKSVRADAIPKNELCLDIGPETVLIYEEIIRRAKTVFWNGPLGLFEQKPFDKGTRHIAKSIAKCKGVTIVGGGDTLKAIKSLKVSFSHVSTGGGATLEFIEGKKLPGLPK